MFAALLFTSQLTLALAAPARFESAENYYKEARFVEAAAELENVLKQKEAARALDASLLLGACYVALGKDGAARRAFVSAFEIDGSAALPPRSSPKVIEAFEKARAEFASLPALLAWSEPVSAPSPLGPGSRVRVRTRHVVGKNHALTLYWRVQGEAEFRRTLMDLRPDGMATVDVVPAGAATIVSAAMFVEARENEQLRLTLASAENPLLTTLAVHRVLAPSSTAGSTSATAVAAAPGLSPPAEGISNADTTPVYKKGWFWGVVVGVAAVAAGAAVAAVVVTRNAAPPPSGDLVVGFEVAR